MHFQGDDGYFLLDVMISLVVVSVVAEMIYKYYSVVSDSIRYVCTKQHHLQRAIQAMDFVLYTKNKLSSHDDEGISVRYTHFASNAIEEKPLNYSYNFETDFVVVTITATCNTVKQEDASLVLVSVLRKH